MSITVDPLTACIGAVVEGVDLREPLDDAAFTAIHRAFLEHQVIFLPDQPIGPRALLAFAERFGPLDEPHPLLPHRDEDPRVTIVLNNAQRPPNNDQWHSDVTFKEAPPLGSLLQALELPARGGDTLWCSMYAVHDALPAELRRRLAGMTAQHSIEAFSGGIHDTEDGARVRKVIAEWPPFTHPVIRTHPETGRDALFVNEVFTTRINELDEAASAALLGELFALVKKPEFQVRYRWRENTIALWDNRCTQHYGVADYFPQQRRMNRVTIAGDRPFFRTESAAQSISSLR